VRPCRQNFEGRKQADLPIQQPMKFDFAVNLKAAQQTGLTIPQSALFRVDKVIHKGLSQICVPPVTWASSPVAISLH
jgi:hypothetical protein